MLGAIAGDIIGSVYEGKTGWQSARRPHFEPLFMREDYAAVEDLRAGFGCQDSGG